MATLTPDQRELIARLRQSDVVDHVEYDYYNISIWFKSGYKERWALHQSRRKTIGRLFIPGEQLLIQPIPTLYEFETKLFDDERNKLIKQHFAIQYSDVIKGGFGDIRLKIHELIVVLLKEGWINPRYPIEALDQDKYNLFHKPCDNYAPSVNYVTLYGYRNAPGYITASHFAKDLGSVVYGTRVPLCDAWGDKEWLKSAIESNLRLGRDVTRTSLIRLLTAYVRVGTKLCGFKYTSPLFYHAILTKILKLKNPVILDAKPFMGTLLMATALSKGTYITKNDNTVDVVAMGEHFGIETAEDDGETTADIVFTGVKNFTPAEAIDLINTYKHRCDMLIIPMNPWNGDILRATHPPKRTIRAKLGINQVRFFDSFFIY